MRIILLLVLTAILGWPLIGLVGVIALFWTAIACFRVLAKMGSFFDGRE